MVGGEANPAGCDGDFQLNCDIRADAEGKAFGRTGVCFPAVHDDDIGMVVDVGVDFVRVVTLVDINFKGFLASGLWGVRHDPERIIRSFRGGVAVAAFEVAVLEMLFGPDVARGPIVATAFLFFVE